MTWTSKDIDLEAVGINVRDTLSSDGTHVHEVALSGSEVMAGYGARFADGDYTIYL